MRTTAYHRKAKITRMLLLNFRISALLLAIGASYNECASLAEGMLLWRPGA